MFFYLSKILGFFVHPLHAVLALLVGALVAGWCGARALRSYALAASVLLLLLIGAAPVSDALLRPLEDRFEQPPIDGLHPRGLIVLGGGFESGLVSQTRGGMSFNDRAERMTKTVELARRFPDMTIVFSGYSGKIVPHGASESEIARQFFEEQGIAPERILYENRSRNTFQNALFTKQLVNPKEGETWLLITSAFHMPRSVGIFRKIGWTVVPFPVDFKTPKGTDKVAFDVGEGGEKIHLALHEWVGLVAYYLSGKSTSLFPAADEAVAQVPSQHAAIPADGSAVRAAHTLGTGAGQTDN